MKQISKNTELRLLIQYRANGGTYGDMPTDVKNDLKRSLIKEQGHICCYCMKRIPQKLKAEEAENNYPNSKIEHVKCQSKNADMELSYQNMLLACNGNHGQPRIVQTCDTFKGENDLSFNPANSYRNIEDYIKYKSNGEIYSDNGTINAELSEVLNLNTKNLRDVRGVFYKQIQLRIILEGKRRNGKDRQKQFYESEKEKLLSKYSEKFFPYCMIGVYLINKKLKKYN